MHRDETQRSGNFGVFAQRNQCRGPSALINFTSIAPAARSRPRPSSGCPLHRHRRRRYPIGLTSLHPTPMRLAAPRSVGGPGVPVRAPRSERFPQINQRSTRNARRASVSLLTTVCHSPALGRGIHGRGHHFNFPGAAVFFGIGQGAENQNLARTEKVPASPCIVFCAENSR